MSSYKQLLAKREELEAEIELAKQAEASVALEQIREQVQLFGFTPEDVFGKPGKKAKRVLAPSTNLFRNPHTGDAWTGRGRMPAWLKDQDIEQFRVSA
ncbi:H-NS histone family protein [Paraburkholderia xenovorans]|uniref:H-NS histone family protein n=1 Tax=Paraburkholderia xenovorans TaxID=36873 RepID=UPI0038BA33A6